MVTRWEIGFWRYLRIGMVVIRGIGALMAFLFFLHAVKKLKNARAGVGGAGVVGIGWRLRSRLHHRQPISLFYRLLEVQRTLERFVAHWSANLRPCTTPHPNQYFKCKDGLISIWIWWRMLHHFDISFDWWSTSNVLFGINFRNEYCQFTESIVSVVDCIFSLSSNRNDVEIAQKTTLPDFLFASRRWSHSIIKKEKKKKKRKRWWREMLLIEPSRKE